MQSAVGPYGAKFAKRRSSPNTITGMLLLVGDHLPTLTRLVSGTRWTLRRLRRSFWLDESSKRIAFPGFITKLNFILIKPPVYLYLDFRSFSVTHYQSLLGIGHIIRLLCSFYSYSHCINRPPRSRLIFCA